ncbi:MAG TPA: hypothetical protein VNM90_05840 [Haliangium sp.]|nr:hypothetical protein [Haliangium sp.]
MPDKRSSRTDPISSPAAIPARRSGARRRRSDLLDASGRPVRCVDAASRGKPAPEPPIQSAGNVRTRQHFLGSTNFLPPADPEALPTEFEAVAITSNPDGTCYTFTDVGVWDTTGSPIGNVEFVEEYDAGQSTKIRTVGNTALGVSHDAEGDSYTLTDDCSASGFSVSGVVETYVARPTRGNEIEYVTPTITAPVDTVGGECVSVCLNRTWTGDCDYDLTGTPQALKLPLAGCVDISAKSSTPYSFDPAAIASYANDPAVTPPGFIRLTLTDVGGGCDVDNNNSFSLPMRTFWQSVTLQNNNDTLCWDMTGANAESHSLGEDQTVVYANGFMVGDGQIQSKYETLEIKADHGGDVREHLPKRWHQDYQSSATMHRAR